MWILICKCINLRDMTLFAAVFFWDVANKNNCQLWLKHCVGNLQIFCKHFVSFGFVCCVQRCFLETPSPAVHGH